jgi:hypothetical protein
MTLGSDPRSFHRPSLTLIMACLLLVASSAPVGAMVVTVRDVGAQARLPQAKNGGYSIQPRDVNGDGWVDLFVGHHGSGAQLFLNRRVGSSTTGFRLAFTFVDTIHRRRDRHDCAWGDVDRNGLDDLYCAKGAHGGTVKKWNELWMQQPGGTFVDEAHAYGVEDVWGRGRHVAFLDLNHDAFPDLFVGNDTPRRDGRPTPNRTFVNVHGTSFEQVRWGLTHEVGARSVQVLDFNHDGWDDLLVCGEHDLKLYLRRPGKPRFVDRADNFGLPSMPAVSARIVDLTGDRHGDLVIDQRYRLTIRLRTHGRFGPAVYRRRLFNGSGFAVGDIDGVTGKDIFAVQGCVEGTNRNDILLLNRRNGRRWLREAVPGGIPGCGRAAATIDFDRDGRSDVVVLNGGGRFGPGPDQLLTTGAWPG